jgi:uncharacterized protein (DUF849 family)
MNDNLTVDELYSGVKTKRKVIITCAVTGGHSFNPRHPSFPVTPAQIADAALEAEKAGAAIIHFHVRNPETQLGSRDPALFRDMLNRVRDRGVTAIINLTCGDGASFVPDPLDEARAAPGTDMATVEDRIAHVAELLPDMCSLDVTTQNQPENGQDSVYMNTPRTLRGMAKRFQELGVKPEIELFAPGDLLLARQMMDEGLFDAPPMFQIVLGVRWGLPATVETLIYMRSLLPQDCTWAAFGLGRMQMPLLAQTVLLGGNVRVGLEDNLYLDRGTFATNGSLVERAANIIGLLGEDVATPDDARAMLNLKPRKA